MANHEERISFLADFELRGDRQVERSLDGIVRQMIRTGSVAESAGLAVEKLFRVFNLGLGGAILGSAIGLTIEKVTDLGTKLNQLQDSAYKLSSGNIEIMNSGAIEKSIDTLKGKVEEAGRESSHTWWDNFTAGLVDASYGLSQPIYKAMGIDLSAMSPEGQVKDEETTALIKLKNLRDKLDKEDAATIKKRGGEDYDFKIMSSLNEKPSGTSHIDQLNLELDHTHTLIDRAREDMKLLDDVNRNTYKSIANREKDHAEALAKIGDLTLQQQKIQAELDKPKKYTATSMRKLGAEAGEGSHILAHLLNTSGGGDLPGVSDTDSPFTGHHSRNDPNHLWGTGSMQRGAFGKGAGNMALGEGALGAFFKGSGASTQADPATATKENTIAIRANTEALHGAMKSNSSVAPTEIF